MGKRPNKTILAIDQGTHLGWALYSKKTHMTEVGLQVFDLKRGESPGMRWIRFDKWLNDIYELNDNDIDLLVYEQAHHRGGAPTQVAYGFITRMQAMAALHNTNIVPVHTATLKKESTGSGKASKEDMIKVAREKYHYKGNDDNEADALHLLAHGLRQY